MLLRDLREAELFAPPKMEIGPRENEELLLQRIGWIGKG
jgi:hypothetical protein